MKKFNYRHITLITLAFVFFSITALWSWNTLAALYQGPVAEYRHIIAAMALLMISSWCVLPGDKLSGIQKRLHHQE